MIDPKAVTNFSRTTSELQAFWLFCIFVAGKNSDRAASCVNKFLAKNKNVSPFKSLMDLGESGIRNMLVANRTGQYERITGAIMGSLKLDLRLCTLDDLLAIRGVGNKTARFFLLHSRHGCEYAVLDTHILAWINEKGVSVPSVTPTNPKVYKNIEQTFLSLIKTLYPHMTPADADLVIWTERSKRNQEVGEL